MKLRSVNRWIICANIVCGAVLFGFVAAQTQAGTLTVISLADSGPGSLRQAIADAAPSGDTISFDPVLTGKTIVLTSGELLVNKSLTITGLGAANLTISGNSLGRVFHLTGSVTTTISGLTITGGVVVAENGGAVQNESGNTLTLSGCVLTGNNGQSGGAVDNAGSLTINSSAISNNAATADGGAVYNIGTLAVADSTLVTNSAANGGGIGNTATLTVTSCTVAGNTANLGGAIYSTNGALTVTGTVLARNIAAGAGGAIYSDLGNTATITGASALSGNNSGDAGGGVYSAGPLFVSGSVLTNNLAVSLGGGIRSSATLSLTNTAVASNFASQGGGIYADNGPITVDDSRLAGNQAAAGSGGALYSSSGSLSLTGSRLTENQAVGGSGGGIYATSGTVTMTGSQLTSNQSTNGPGGGLYSSNSTVTVTGTMVANNVAKSAAGGGIYSDLGNTLTITGDSTLAGNSGDTGGGLYNAAIATVAGSILTNNSAVSVGGGIVNFDTLTVTNSTLIGNSALDISAGGLYSATGSVVIVLSTLAGNHADLAGGGAILNDANSTLTLTESTLTGNTAGAGGGLLNVGTVTVSRSTVDHNVASADQGGGIYNDVTGTLLIALSTLANNSAATAGGGLLNFGTVTLAESTLAGNGAEFGGALANTGTVTVDNTIFAGSPTGGNLIDFGTIISKGHNLSDDASGNSVLIGPGDLTERLANLGSLQNNGGPTFTMALGDGSAAIGAGGPAFPPFSTLAGGGGPIYPPYTDQRGFARFACGSMDIGAYQSQYSPPADIALVGDSVVTLECPATFTDLGATATNNCGDALNVSGGGTHSLGLRTDGTVEAWGEDANGQTDVPGNLANATAISAGGYHSLALNNDGTVFAWGDNASGQISIPGTVTNAIAVAAGGYHSLALQDGLVIGWGDNSFGQTNVPASATNVVAIAAGRYHSLALQSDGTVVAWGAGTFIAGPEDGINYGQSIVPAAATNAIAISAGAYHSLALLNDRTVIAWGAGTTNVSLFVDFGQAQVPEGLSNVMAIAAGGYHSLALLSNATVKAWGNNDYLQSTVPGSLDNSVLAIAAGAYHSLAITIAGTVSGWGLTNNGQTSAGLDLNTDLTGFIVVTTNGTTSGLGTFTNTYTIVTSMGVTSSVTRSVTTVDTAVPVPNVALLPIITNQCAFTLTAPTATDACIGPVTGTTTDNTHFNTSGTFVVTWKYSDGHGNTVTQQQTVVTGDTLPPVPDVASLPSITNNCTVILTAPTATDNCAGTVTATTTNATTYNTAGTFVVTWTYSDGHGNSTTQLQTAVVLDNVPPSPTVAPLPTITNQCSVTLLAPTATDNCAGTVTATTTNATTYNTPGTNTVTWIYVDGHGNSTTQQQLVVIADILPPVPTVAPLPMITNQCSVTLSAPTATDNCAGTVTATTTNATTYNTQGTNTVTWIYTDGRGNSTTQQQTVAIADTLPPVPNVASLPTITNQCSVTLAAPTATDNCAGTVTATTTNLTTYNIPGTYHVTWTYADGHGNSATQQQTAVVIDTLPPVPNVASLPTITNSCSVTLVPPTAHDDCAGTVTGTTASATTYIAPGTFDVTWNYTDGHGNSTNQLQTVVITRVSPPVIVCSHDIVLSNNVGPCGTTVVYPVPIITPNCPGNVITRIAGLASGSVFPPGVTTNMFQVIDVLGKTNTCSFTVKIVVSQPPSLVCPDNLTVPTAPGQCKSAPVHFAPTVADTCPGVTVVSAPTNGAVFAKGTNTVVCKATAFGLTNTCSFTVTVVDQEAPTIHGCPSDIVTNALSLGGTPVTFAEPTASDNCSNVIPVVHAPGSPVSGNVFPIGDTEVVRLATDASGNQNVCVFTVRVLGPQGSFESLLHDLAVLRDATATGSGGRQLSQVINNLLRANKLWRLDGRIDAGSGRAFFKRTQSADRLLLKLLKGRHDTIPDATLQAFVDRLTTVDRLLALTAINDAIVGRANARAIAGAKRDELKGEADEAHDNTTRAIGHYQRAWRTAVKALTRVS